MKEELGRRRWEIKLPQASAAQSNRVCVTCYREQFSSEL